VSKTGMESNENKGASVILPKPGKIRGTAVPLFRGGYYSILAKTRASGKLYGEVLKLLHSSSNLF